MCKKFKYWHLRYVIDYDNYWKESKLEYTINKVAKISGVSTRTLRYYDEIGLLKPKRINSSGYRIYSQNEIDKLQQILFYKELDLPLNCIS